MTQKIIKVGTSAAVTIPKKSLGELEVKIGDKVIVTIDRKKKVVVIEPVKKKTKKKINTELIAWTDNFIEQYRSAFEALVKK